MCTGEQWGGGETKRERERLRERLRERKRGERERVPLIVRGQGKGGRQIKTKSDLCGRTLPGI